MQTSIVKWGNSQGIRLPKHLLESANLTENDIVEVTAQNGRIIIKKLRVKKQYKTIQERFSDFDGDYESVDMDWGKPAGKEIW
ncbi:AbrB/MazE/SpoVT family DNA-binding domain-containing protein [Desulfococcaceae bacterium OttesenSCG-928-F15]|nr:AbrB/MazE/SpoVT family DNA-binding domain-containing protein [Desulfococcaceae bacterium OttesenSCG-928-F15]